MYFGPALGSPPLPAAWHREREREENPRGVHGHPVRCQNRGGGFLQADPLTWPASRWLQTFKQEGSEASRGAGSPGERGRQGPEVRGAAGSAVPAASCARGRELGRIVPRWASSCLCLSLQAASPFGAGLKTGVWGPWGGSANPQARAFPRAVPGTPKPPVVPRAGLDASRCSTASWKLAVLSGENPLKMSMQPAPVLSF